VNVAKPRVGRQLAAFVGGLTAAALLMFGLLQFRVLQWQSGTVATLAAAAPDVALTSARTPGSLRAVLATGGISPRGRTAVTVGPAAALLLADNYLHGTDGAARDQGEASFWLRHALSHALDHDSMKWSLTQLGSIYAAPDGFEPDYAKARLLWEISGALGDPVALCFNASLYEYGLGVAKHKPLARALYERARNAGGCRNVDDAIARTR
jgi:TPR repeat protein